jgi:hypothetical protein
VTLTQVAPGESVHRSELLQNNTIVVHGRAGALLVDPGITGDELTCLANDLRASGRCRGLRDASFQRASLPFRSGNVRIAVRIGIAAFGSRFEAATHVVGPVGADFVTIGRCEPSDRGRC